MSVGRLVGRLVGLSVRGIFFSASKKLTKGLQLFLSAYPTIISEEEAYIIPNIGRSICPSVGQSGCH